MSNDPMEIAECSVIITESFEDEKNNVTIIKDEEYTAKFSYAEIWEKGFLYNGRLYSLVSWSTGFDDDVFHQLPFYNRVYSHLKEALEKIRKNNEITDIMY